MQEKIMKKVINLIIILLLTSVSLFSDELKGKEIGDGWILSKAEGIDVVSKKSADEKAIFSVGNINGQLVAIVTNKSDTTEANQKAVPVARVLKVEGMNGEGYQNNAMLVGNHYFQYLEYWQLLNLNIDKIKVVMQDRSDKEISSTIEMKGYINALKRIYSKGKNDKGEDKYKGYKNLNDGWQYRETKEYKEISKEFLIIPEMDKDYGQLRNRMVIRNYNGVLWGGFEFARPFDMRETPDEIQLYTENSGDKIYVVSPIGTLDEKQQNVKIAIAESAIKELKSSKVLTVDIIPAKNGDFYNNTTDPSEVDLTGFGKAMEKLGKYKIAKIEDLK